jgi:broad specificity polyphosphatase/5'/3'-nucleotidase SurE
MAIMQQQQPPVSNMQQQAINSSSITSATAAGVYDARHMGVPCAACSASITTSFKDMESSAGSSSSFSSSHHHHHHHHHHIHHHIHHCIAGSCIAPPLVSPRNLRGCMLGRAAMDHPAQFCLVDEYFYNDITDIPNK